jgi:hypothetical protein
MARHEPARVRADSAEAAAQLQRVSDLVRDACMQIEHMLIAMNSRLSAEERRRFEYALGELRHAIDYLALQGPHSPDAFP